MRPFHAVLVLLSVPLLGGCVAGMAVSAAGMAARAAQGTPEDNSHLGTQAVTACSERAAQYGTVHIIDVERRSIDKLIVWGTATEGTQRQSFQCGFGTKITSFKIKPIKA